MDPRKRDPHRPTGYMMRWLGATAALYAFRVQAEAAKKTRGWCLQDSLDLIATNVRSELTQPSGFLRPTEEDLVQIIEYGQEDFREYLSGGVRELNELNSLFQLLNQFVQDVVRPEVEG